MKKKKGKIKLAIGLSVLLVMVIAITLFFTIHKDRNNDTFIHLSFDDTITVFEDLTDNVNEYDTVFDNDFLSYLKKLHDNYGAVFSLYCFYKSEDFNLSECTDKFASEFAGNSDWLKFGFHNISGEGNLADANSQQAEEDYKKVITELIRITGGSDCIDTFVRLQNFAGSLDAVETINNTSNGIDGLLSADDDRDSYYLKGEENSYIDTHDFFEDDNGIYFVSTDLRLENTINPYYLLTKIADDPNQNKCIEVFTHEWQMGKKMKLKLLATCFFAYKEGYTWDYPMYRYGK